MTLLRRRHLGFTLMELLIGMAVIAIMSATAFGGYSMITSRSDDQAAQVNVEKVLLTLRTYVAENGAWPADFSELSSISGVQVTQTVSTGPDVVSYSVDLAGNAAISAISSTGSCVAVKLGDPLSFATEDWVDLPASAPCSAAATLGVAVAVPSVPTTTPPPPTAPPSPSAPALPPPTTAPPLVQPFSAPTGFTVSPTESGDDRLLLVWNEVADPPSGPVLGYVVERLNAVDGTVEVVDVVPAPSTTYTATGLSAGVVYTHQVHAYNASEHSPASLPRTATPIGVPQPPVITAVTSTDNSVTVTFSIVSSQEAPVAATSASRDGTVVTSNLSTASGSGYTFRFNQLESGNSYTLLLRTSNSVGVASASSTILVQLAQAPSAPTGLALEAGSSSLALSWSAPPGPVDGYLLERLNSTSQLFETIATTGPATSYLDTDLSGGTSYTYRVRAFNSGGTGDPSTSQSGTPLSSPGPPTIVSIAPGSGQLSVDFLPPVDNGGADITNYQYSTDAGSTWRNRSDGGGGSAPLLITTISGQANTALLNGSTYQVQVRAVNEIGAGQPSQVSTSLVALYSFSTATFSPGGASGRSGPTLAQARTGLTGPGTEAWEGNMDFFGVSGGVQMWTVPLSGTYRITASGASGARGFQDVWGRGAIIQGDFDLQMGQKIKILVGHQGTAGGGNSCGTSGGGGGGTFVMKETGTSDSDILAIAGGGGGGGTRLYDQNRVHATASNAGNKGDGAAGGAGGSSGNAGATGTGCVAGGSGGAGLRGGSATAGAFGNGGLGGANGINGGFGGGGSTLSYCGGGGGGYSGGGGGGLVTCSCADLSAGGGGGSFNNGISQVATVGAGGRAGHGEVTIVRMGAGGVSDPTAPEAPSIQSITGDDQEMNVTFTPPAFNGGSPITDYQYSTDSGVTWKTRADGSTGTTLTITTLSSGPQSLDNYTTYPVMVRGVNAVGNGQESYAFNGTTQMVLRVVYGGTRFSPALSSQTSPPTVTGGSGSRTFSLQGTLPPEMTFNSATGVFTGPVSWGAVLPQPLSVTVTVTDDDPRPTPVSITLNFTFGLLEAQVWGLTDSRIEWETVASAASYQVAVSPPLGGPHAVDGTTATLASAMEPGQQYTFTVTALNGAGTAIDTFSGRLLVYGHTGAAQTFTVPAGVEILTATACGARGGDYTPNNPAYGRGGCSTAMVDTTPSTVMNLYVGGRGGNHCRVTYTSASAPNCSTGSGWGLGGWNGGGAGGPGGPTYYGGWAGGGGGASDIRVGGSSLADRVLVAGGGGGSLAQGGHGGGTTGLPGANIGANGGLGGGGGTAAAGGAGGNRAGYIGGNGANGSLGVGGAGGLCPHSWCFGGGGGGGGYYGGGGGESGDSGISNSGAGGGGGSSYAGPNLRDVTHRQGDGPNGHGVIIFAWA